LELAYRFSPLIEEASEDTVVLDVTGLTWRFVSCQALADAIAASAATLGVPVHVALANDPDTAIHLARFAPGIQYVPPGAEAEHLARLPLRVIDSLLAGVDVEIGAEILETLFLWGLETFGDFASLPEEGIAARLGQEGIKLQRLVKGTNHRHIIARELAPEFDFPIELDHHLREMEPLSFVLSRQLHQLCDSLNAAALATNEIRLRLRLDRKGGRKEEQVRVMNLPCPMRDPKTLLKLLLLNIEINQPDAPISALSVSCIPVKPRAGQGGLFEPLSPQPDKLELTLARIRNLVGAGNLGMVELLNTHRPDAFVMKPFTVSGPRWRLKPQIETEKDTPLAGFRRFRPPLLAEVEMVGATPTQVTVRHGPKKLSGTVVKLAGPWRTKGDWWRDDQWARDEWDISLQEAANEETLYRIFRELESDKWYVEGVYD
jgi:protein ImuB